MTKNLQQAQTGFLFNRLLVVLLLGSLVFYVLMRMQALHMERKQLELRQENIRNAFMQAGNSRMPLHIVGEYDITENGTVPENRLGEPRDTVIYYAAKEKRLPFEMLTGAFTVNEKYYQLTTYVSSTEIAHLIIKVFIIEACLFALLFIVIIYINRKTSGILWAPFRDTLKKLNTYDITRHQPVDLRVDTGIAEFNELNTAATQLIANNRQAYHHQKQFVENASHEIQTPLAIIRSKLELLINQPDITEEVAGLLADITEANDRLSQMNRNLLLLAKIENNQFPGRTSIDLSALLNRIIATHQQHYAEKFPVITKTIQPDVFLNANLSLVEILINNLVRNAVLHNIPAGSITIKLDNQSFTISNSGKPAAIAAEQLFERFSKGSDELKSTGLGLALVKQICQLYHFTIVYAYADGVHTMKLSFTGT
jgi:signal transduction histidine kinase